MKSLEDENRRMKKLLAESMLDNAARKKRLRPAARRLAVNRLIEQHGLSQRRACRLVGTDHSIWRYQPRRADDSALRQQGVVPDGRLRERFAQAVRPRGN